MNWSGRLAVVSFVPQNFSLCQDCKVNVKESRYSMIGHIIKRCKNSYPVVLNLGRDPAIGIFKPNVGVSLETLRKYPDFLGIYKKAFYPKTSLKMRLFCNYLKPDPYLKVLPSQNSTITV